MFEYWKKIDNLQHHNRLLLAFIGLLSVIVLALIINLMTMPKRYEFWLSPNMAANGGLMKASDVPNEYIQGFVSSLIPTLYTWSNKGKEEFNQNIKAFHYYFTSRHEQLLRDTLGAYKNAQLFDRSQVASLYRFMEPQDIRKIAPDTWEVKLILRITQRLKDNSGMVIADKVVAYHLRVVKLNLSRLHNPFQLALDGYTRPEERLQDLLVDTEESHETH
ncbi:TIGR03746 family integrating conjugative element protein [Legionella pneumophila serogroup 1]